MFRVVLIAAILFCAVVLWRMNAGSKPQSIAVVEAPASIEEKPLVLVQTATPTAPAIVEPASSNMVPSSPPSEAAPPVLPKKVGVENLEQTLLKDAHGQPLTVGQVEAAAACEKQGMRLPTVRELAEFAALRGAQGILPATETEGRIDEKEVRSIKAKNQDGQADEFYYGHIGFRPYNGLYQESGEPLFWSSSKGECLILEGERAKFCGYVLHAHKGQLSGKYDWVQGQANCVREKKVRSP